MGDHRSRLAKHPDYTQVRVDACGPHGAFVLESCLELKASYLAPSCDRAGLVRMAYWLLGVTALGRLGLNWEWHADHRSQHLPAIRELLR